MTHSQSFSISVPFSFSSFHYAQLVSAERHTVFPPWQFWVIYGMCFTPYSFNIAKCQTRILITFTLTSIWTMVVEYQVMRKWIPICLTFAHNFSVPVKFRSLVKYPLVSTWKDLSLTFNNLLLLLFITHLSD